MTAAPHRRYALLAAADALEADDYRLQALIADDGKDAPLTAAQVIAYLRVLAAVEKAEAEAVGDSWTTANGDTVELYRSAKFTHEMCPETCPSVLFRFRVRARNGEIVATGSEGYTRKWSAKRAAVRSFPPA